MKSTRPLSTLQRCILTLAAQNGGRLDRVATLERYYGWTRQPNGKFPFTRIGRLPYVAAQVDLGRSIRRLQARGLLTAQNHLTRNGRRLAS